MTTTDTIRMLEVGGCVRDEALNGLRRDARPPHDIDMAVEITGATDVDHAFARLLLHLGHAGFEIFLVTPEFLTVRARFPQGHAHHARLTADFVLCRTDGPSSDGRHPDFVEPGTIEDDLARRDFTVNAMARDPETGEFIDPHNGIADLNRMTLRAVGDPMTRFREDGLRALRALRFVVTKGFTLDAELAEAVRNPETATLLDGVSTERIREELHKAFAADTPLTLALLCELPLIRAAIFRDGLSLKPTLERL